MFYILLLKEIACNKAFKKTKREKASTFCIYKDNNIYL